MSATPSSLPLILLPGVGTDEALFRLQRIEFPHIVVPEWIEPRRNERVEAYAARLAETIHPGGPCIVGGASFGGIVAQELARHLPAVACVLVATIRSSRQLPWFFRVWKPFAKIIPGISAGVSGWLAAGLRVVGGRRWKNSVRTALTSYSAADGRFQRWAAIATLRWKPKPLPCPIYQIHGDKDRVFPARRSKSDRIIEGGGHLLTLTHPFAVNAFLQETLSRATPAGIEVAAIVAQPDGR